MNIGVILSGGNGSRFGSEIPKQYLKLNGSAVIEYSFRAFADSSMLDACIVMVSPNYYNERLWYEKYNIVPVLGGDSRNASLKKAIDYIAENYPTCKKIFIHEAARPFLTAAIIDDYINKLEEFDAVITTKKITDSLGSVKEWYVNRDDYFLIQAPEAFLYTKLRDSFKEESLITATVQQLPEKSKVYHNFSFVNNLKITYPEDLIIAEKIMTERK